MYEADPRWLVMMAMVAFYFTIGYTAYNGRNVRFARQSTSRYYTLEIEHHKESVVWMLLATLLLLVLVVAVKQLAAPQPRSVLFWVHESLNATFALLAVCAYLFNGTRSVSHKYFAYVFGALSVPIGITGGILLYQLRF